MIALRYGNDFGSFMSYPACSATGTESNEENDDRFDFHCLV